MTKQEKSSSTTIAVTHEGPMGRGDGTGDCPGSKLPVRHCYWPWGSTVKKIIDQYKVQVRVPREGSKDEPILVEGKTKLSLGSRPPHKGDD
ncbi:hypothetical protein Hamer_G028574 [Homarus americanus]|uniref:Uncharacterized protein n=1 Tax=Homarus americanus TaxID=6706 RepID=A0A8J5N3Z4_HOMAM|nr:hypothetical protein Hamer_G028574 [Homarus americanus]